MYRQKKVRPRPRTAQSLAPRLRFRLDHKTLQGLHRLVAKKKDDPCQLSNLAVTPPKHPSTPVKPVLCVRFLGALVGKSALLRLYSQGRNFGEAQSCGPMSSTESRHVGDFLGIFSSYTKGSQGSLPGEVKGRDPLDGNPSPAGGDRFPHYRVYSGIPVRG
jgi:hypothetical protein